MVGEELGDQVRAGREQQHGQHGALAAPGARAQLCSSPGRTRSLLGQLWWQQAGHLLWAWGDGVLPGSAIHRLGILG